MTKGEILELRWIVEDVGVHANILHINEEPIGLGFPVKLAYSIVKKHNETIELLMKEMKENEDNSK